jgi:beta-galactosidase
MGGCFIWTGFDYYGEPSPLAWPSVASSYGIMDLCGFKKDYYYYYQAHWTVTPVLHLLPSWNAEQLEIAADGTTPVRVYTNADEVQIWVNNHNYGKHSVKDCTVNLRVPFVAGTLKAEAFKNGQSMGTVTQTTTTAATHLTTKCLIADDQIQLYEVQAVDDQNHFVNNAQNTVEVTVNNGEIWALSNGDVFNHDEKHLRLFNGRGLIIVRPQGKANVQTILC